MLSSNGGVAVGFNSAAGGAAFAAARAASVCAYASRVIAARHARRQAWLLCNMV